MARENRFVKYWLAPLVLLVVVAGVAITLTVLQDSWWNDRGRPPSADQRATDGTTPLTQAGRDYAAASGVLIVRVGEGALPAEELGLEADGELVVDPSVPIQVRILAPEGALVLDLMDAVVVTTQGGVITRLDLSPWGALSFREFTALLDSRAETVGWTDDELAALEDDLSAAQRARDGDRYSAALAGGTALGVTVSAEVTVDLAASATWYAVVVER